MASICNGVLFHQESPNRVETFVSRKSHELFRGSSLEDISDLARKFRCPVRQGTRMIAWNATEDATARCAQKFVIVTGKRYSARQLVEHAAAHVGIQ